MYNIAWFIAPRGEKLKYSIKSFVQRLTALVSGNVQGVGFRHFTRKKSIDLGLTGYAENLMDGRVEVVVEGERHDLELMVKFLWQGPRGSRIDSMDLQWGDAAGLVGFHSY